jgi:uncharacterized SAM-binding protein YcdF (DUF218 family)
MNPGWLLTNFIAAFLLPPLNLTLLGLVGMALLKRRQVLGRILIGISLLGLWLLSTPMFAAGLLDRLKPPPHQPHRGEAQAIVILGGGSYRNTLEYGGDAVGRLTLERLRYGATLARRTGLPVLVTGGAPDGGQPEARLMRAVLETEFGVPVRWVEDGSDNTRENAVRSAVLLKRAGLTRIYLVSHAWHLSRAVSEFERAGLKVIPAGLGYARAAELSPMDFVPNAKALLDSYYAMHEGIGLVWYRMRNLL